MDSDAADAPARILTDSDSEDNGPYMANLFRPEDKTEEDQPKQTAVGGVQPNVSAFSCTLLIWLIAMVMFGIACVALRYNGLWCPAPMNNATIVRKGLLIQNLHPSSDPCTNFYEYACGGYTATHATGSTLADLQFTNFLQLAAANLSVYARFTPTPAMSGANYTIDWYALRGIYPGFSIDVSPSMQNPLVYALYVTPTAESANRYTLLATLPACFSPVTPLAALMTDHIRMGHDVYLANEIGACAAYVSDQTPACAEEELLAVLEESAWEQVQRYYPNTLSTAFANGRSSAYITAFVDTIKRLVIDYVETTVTWLDDTSRSAAIQKIQQVTVLAGTGQTNIDDCTTTTSIGCLTQQWEKTNALVGGTVNPQREWKIAASAANAYYSPSHNHICIPFGIATVPFYSEDYPPAWNLAALGVIVAHELGHSIDAHNGVYYDARGLYGAWLTQTSATRLLAYTDCLENLYDRSGMAPALNEYTVDENMADQIAVQSVFDLRTATSDAFVVFAQTWCGVDGDQLRDTDTTDPHAANILRVNVTMEYLPAFQRVFQCPRVPSPCVP